MLEAAALGASAIPAAVFGLVAAVTLVDGFRGQLGEVFAVAVAGSILGIFVGGPLGAVARGFVALAWPVSPKATFAFGPSLGAIGAVLVFELLALGFSGELDDELGDVAFAAGMGSFAVGPTWIAWIAVRARGRHGWPVIVGAAVWASALTGSATLVAWLFRGY